MNEMKELRRLYESAEIPDELSARVNQALHQQEDRQGGNLHSRKIRGILKMNEVNNKAKKSSSRIFRGVTAGAAAFAVLFGSFAFGVSANEAFADSMSNVPILGGLVRVLTGEKVDETDDVARVNMALPKVEGLADKALQERINKEIQDKMTGVVKEAKERAAENKKAWLATGGLEKDYMTVDIDVNYEVKTIDDNVLSFLVTKTETGASAYFEEYFYNIDLKANKELTLADLLGADYKEIANREIKAQILQRSKNPDNMYFDGTDGVEGFTSISDNQNFYVNKAGNPVIIFNKYEIAPGSMGIQEFEITK